MLRAAAATSKLLLLRTENSREWTHERAVEVVSSLEAGAARGVECCVVPRGRSIDPESGLPVEDFSSLFRSATRHVLAFADGIDREVRSSLKAKGLARYEKISQEEIDSKEAAKEAARMAAKEAAVAMGKNDAPVHFDPDDFE